MDTLVTIEIEDGDRHSTLASEGIKIMEELQNKFDLNLASSDIGKINASAGVGPIEFLKIL